MDAPSPVRHLGEYIREQRRSSDVSLRQLAKLAGVSNPYLSQIERGLRKPSAEILQQIAKGLRISAEALYVQAGFLDQREGDGAVPDAVLSDDGLTERQKQVLLEIYDSFRKENADLPGRSAPATDGDAAVVSVVSTPAADAEQRAADLSGEQAAPAPRKRAPRKKPAPAAATTSPAATTTSSTSDTPSSTSTPTETTTETPTAPGGTA